MPQFVASLRFAKVALREDVEAATLLSLENDLNGAPRLPVFRFASGLEVYASLFMVST